MGKGTTTLALALTLTFLGCAGSGEMAATSPETSAASSKVELSETIPETTKADEAPQADSTPLAQEEHEEQETEEMKLSIDGSNVSVAWENNQAVSDLKALATENPLTVELSSYGGFEQVGPLGTNLTTSDARITTAPGDIVLYAGNQISIFYGPNTWSYTKLGHITDKTAEELADLLGSSRVSITIAVD